MKTHHETDKKNNFSVSHAPRTSGSGLLLPLLLIAASCSPGGGGAPAEKVNADPTVEEKLEALGVDTTEPPHEDADGEPYPEDYSPLGVTYELEKLSELVVLGMAPTGATDRWSLVDLELDAGDPAREPRLLSSVGSGEAPWVLEEVPASLPPMTQRSGASADVDGDGREEQVYAHFEGATLSFTLAEDTEAGYALSTSVVLELPEPLLDVTVCGADVDADGVDELLLGYSLAFEAHVAIVEYVDEAWIASPEPVLSFPTELSGSVVLLELAAANLDYDGAEEIAVIANEYLLEEGPSTYGHEALGCRGYVFDDLGAELAVLHEGPVEGRDEFGGVHTALVADLDLGDLDADGLAEVVFAGVVPTQEWCLGLYVLVALDDAVHGLAGIGDRYLEEPVGDEPGSSGCEVVVAWAHVDLVDFMGDHAAEVHVNEMVFADWREASPWTMATEIPGWEPLGTRVDPTMLTFAAGDFTGDVRQDLAVLAQGRDVVVWGIAADDVDQEFKVLETLPMEYDTLSAGRTPQLIPVNPDSDSTMLQYLDHTYLMTEPVIMAVLAAAPSTGGPGQNIDANSTEFGNAHSTTSGREDEVSVSLSFIIGTELLDLGNGWDIEGKLTADYTHVWSSSTTETTSLSFATGPEEDTVICTVAPYDLYRYRVVSDPDPERIGEVVQLFVPQRAVTLQVEREFYNSVVGQEDPKVDHAVFRHTIGELSSYPTALEKDGVLATTEGLETGPVGVGQGAGSTTLGIAVAEGTAGSDYLGVSAEFEATTTIATVKVGFSLGAGYGHTWSWSVDDETSYSGTVGSLDAEHFPSDHYSFGLFCYWHEDPGTGAKYQVLNYWVE